jgi:hypothetical protein
MEMVVEILSAEYNITLSAAEEPSRFDQSDPGDSIETLVDMHYDGMVK